jgi:hypothetical protein
MKKLSMILLAFFALGLTSCAKKKSSDARIGSADGVRGDAGTAEAGAAAQSTLTPACASQYPYIRILQDDLQVEGFRASYVNYFSSVNPISEVNASLGEIDGTGKSTATGVNTQFQFKIVNGQMTSSVLSLIIYDSLSNQNGNTPIQVGYTSGLNHSYQASTGQFSTEFEDKFGKVKVAGVIQGNLARAQITFSNTKSADNAALKSGSLGSFTIPSCAVVSQ